MPLIAEHLLLRAHGVSNFYILKRPVIALDTQQNVRGRPQSDLQSANMLMDGW